MRWKIALFCAYCEENGLGSQKRIQADEEALRLGIDAAAVQKQLTCDITAENKRLNRMGLNTHTPKSRPKSAEDFRRLELAELCKANRHRKAMNKMLAAYLDVEIPVDSSDKEAGDGDDRNDDDKHDDRSQSGDESAVVCDQELEEEETRRQEEEEASARQALVDAQVEEEWNGFSD